MITSSTAEDYDAPQQKRGLWYETKQQSVGEVLIL